VTSPVLRNNVGTGALVRRINPTYVLTAGDHAYPDGTVAEYRLCDQSWGSFKAKTRPAPGNTTTTRRRLTAVLLRLTLCRFATASNPPAGR